MSLDKSIELFMNMGFGVRYPPNDMKGLPSQAQENSRISLWTKKNGLNQVWKADMAHYLYWNTKLYPIYITDVYSQEVVSYEAYSTNHAINYVEVMSQAARRAKSTGQSLKGLIYHSDGGKKDESILYKSLSNRNNI